MNNESKRVTDGSLPAGAAGAAFARAAGAARARGAAAHGADAVGHDHRGRLLLVGRFLFRFDVVAAARAERGYRHRGETERERHRGASASRAAPELGAAMRARELV